MKYFPSITDEQMGEIYNYMALADKKRLPITEKFEFLLSNVKIPFEVRFIPFHEISSLLEFKELDGLRSRLDGTEIQLLEQGYLSNALMEILKYVFQKNKEGHKPTYTEVCKKLNFSKHTCQKKIRALIRYQYLTEIKTGRAKNLIITERGKMTFI
jgi:predicted transcriptional regulator